MGLVLAPTSRSEGSLSRADRACDHIAVSTTAVTFPRGAQAFLLPCVASSGSERVRAPRSGDKSKTDKTMRGGADPAPPLETLSLYCGSVGNARAPTPQQCCGASTPTRPYGTGPSRSSVARRAPRRSRVRDGIVMGVERAVGPPPQLRGGDAPPTVDPQDAVPRCRDQDGDPR